MGLSEIDAILCHVLPTQDREGIRGELSAEQFDTDGHFSPGVDN
jgi:hypothetical protein